jgi:hypothetical protein
MISKNVILPPLLSHEIKSLFQRKLLFSSPIMKLLKFLLLICWLSGRISDSQGLGDFVNLVPFIIATCLSFSFIKHGTRIKVSVKL